MKNIIEYWSNTKRIKKDRILRTMCSTKSGGPQLLHLSLCGSQLLHPFVLIQSCTLGVVLSDWQWKVEIKQGPSNYHWVFGIHPHPEPHEKNTHTHTPAPPRCSRTPKKSQEPRKFSWGDASSIKHTSPEKNRPSSLDLAFWYTPPKV